MTDRRVIKRQTDCDRYQRTKEYTFFQEFLDNLPYILMTVIGAAIFLSASAFSAYGIACASVYVLYGVLGAIWIIVFVLDACVLLPLMARLYGCGHCPQKDDCPWMVGSKKDQVRM